jgi:drug/metabolite transporter (DMT)-like permease
MPVVRTGISPWVGWGLLIVAETASQLFLKIGSGHLAGADGIGQWLLAAASSAPALAGFGCYFLSFLAWMTLLRDSDLSRAYPMTAMVYVAVPVSSVVVLGETIDLTRWLGVAIICVGVMLLAGDGDNDSTAGLEG